MPQESVGTGGRQMGCESMGKALLTQEEFSRAVVTRARQERPDIQVKAMGKFMLLVETEPGRRRVVSLVHLYQAYCECPVDRDEVIGSFLNALVYEEPGMIRGSFEQYRHKIMPQVVPPSLLEFCRREKRELASVDYVGGLSVAFVVDEPERYSYIHRDVVERWDVSETEVLVTALQNLQALNETVPAFHRIGQGERTAVMWETFDGYDASRILLSRELNEMAAFVVGNPIIAIPHRDYLVLFGDANEEFVTEMTERIYEDFEAHSYPITTRFFTLIDGNLALYEKAVRRERFVN